MSNENSLEKAERADIYAMLQERKKDPVFLSTKEVFANLNLPEGTENQNLVEILLEDGGVIEIPFDVELLSPRVKKAFNNAADKGQFIIDALKRYERYQEAKESINSIKNLQESMHKDVKDMQEDIKDIKELLIRISQP